MLSFKTCTSSILEDDNSYFQNLIASNENSPLPWNSSYYSTPWKHLILQTFFFNQYRWHKISHHYFYFHSFNEKLNIIPYFIIFEMLFEFLMWFLVSLFYILICKKVWYILGTNSICPISLLSLSLLFTFFIVTFKNNNKLNSICILTYRKTEISNSWFNATQPVINIAYSNISSFNVDITLKTTKNTASLVLTIILFFA